MMRLLVLLTLCFSFWAGITINAGSAENKRDKKEVKKKCKQLEDEGWGVYGQTTSLYDALLSFYLQSGEDQLQITGFGQAATEVLAVRKATIHASRQVATKKGTSVEGVGKTVMTTTPDGGTETLQNANASSTTQNVKQLTPLLSLTRRTYDGKVEAQVFCLVNPKE